MGETTIEWATDVWNPVTGCTKVSPGCAHCYAERMAKRLAGRFGYPADKPFKVTLHPDRLGEPLTWKKPRRVFVSSMGDLFHKDVPADFLDHVFAIMGLDRRHQYLLLTKRPERAREYLPDRRLCVEVVGQVLAGEACGQYPTLPWPLPNVWLGTSVENQHAADERVPILLGCPAAVRFLSLEPLLGPVDVSDYLTPIDPCPGWPNGRPAVQWVIVGGESGPGARPCNIGWIRSIVQQCQAAGTKCFVKQLGARPVRIGYSGAVVFSMDLDDPKGADPAEWTEDLRVREYPR